jgi:ADP-ribosylglycohydrolase
MNTQQSIPRRERILGGLWGSVVGDALGVPVEFKARDAVQADPVTDMRGHGSHDQPAGTWSDDSSLLLCTADSLVRHEFDTEDMGKRFLAWYRGDLWTARGDVFDVGGATTDALMSIANGTPAEQAGGREEFSNGNGSLMRILPAVLRFTGDPIESFADRIERISSITHGHGRSRMACVLHGLVVRQLLSGLGPEPAIATARTEFTKCYESAHEFGHFRHLLQDKFASMPEGAIVSTGYVLHTLHASLWCLLTSGTFEECVLKAVNLGGDADTAGCVAGGLAGVMYGLQQVPERWRNALARADEIDKLFTRFAAVLTTAP